MITWWIIYATLSNTWTDPEEVSTWSPLTAELWNDTQSNIKYLWERVWGVESSINTLNWTVSNLQSSINVPNVGWQVNFNWRHYKSFWITTYNWSGAVNACNNLWAGWRLPSTWDLLYIYNNKSSLSSLSLQDKRYWSDDLFWDSDSSSHMVLTLRMNNGQFYNYPTNSSIYVVCIHN
jgi:hypothetical protein